MSFETDEKIWEDFTEWCWRAAEPEKERLWKLRETLMPLPGDRRAALAAMTQAVLSGVVWTQAAHAARMELRRVVVHLYSELVEGTDSLADALPFSPAERSEWAAHVETLSTTCELLRVCRVDELGHVGQLVGKAIAGCFILARQTIESGDFALTDAMIAGRTTLAVRHAAYVEKARALHSVIGHVAFCGLDARLEG